MASPEELQDRRDYINAGAVLILYSLVFSAIIFSGYYNLFLWMGRIPAGIAALVVTLCAWTLGRMVGSAAAMIKGSFPIFLMLLLISAVGVFNSFMIHLEGKTVFLEALDSADRRFAALPSFVKKASENKTVDELRALVESKKTALFQEINNPRNCGDGPEAQKILQDIRQILPGFTRLSGNAKDCGNNAELVAMYSEQIDKLLYAHPEFIKANVAEIDALSKRVAAEVPIQQAKIAQLKKDLNAGGSLFNVVRPGLEESAAAYQSLALTLQNTVPAVSGYDGFSSTLDLSSTRNLGEWGHLVTLFLSRVDKLQTWVYFGVALFLDWMLVYLFGRVAASRRGLQEHPQLGGKTPGAIKKPWEI